MTDNERVDKQTKVQNRREESCGCGGKLKEIDSLEQSSTVRCDGCDEVYLMVGRDGGTERKQILLRDWDERRGGHWGHDLAAAAELRMTLGTDQRPTTEMSSEFGIRTERHYLALQSSDASSYELDRVRGDGQAITQLVHQTSYWGFRDLQFETHFDQLYATTHGADLDQRPLNSDLGATRLDSSSEHLSQETRKHLEPTLPTTNENDRGKDRNHVSPDKDPAHLGRQPKREESCGCGGKLKEIDSFEESSTVRCDGCDEVYLMVGRDGVTERKQILLRDWDERRGGDWGRPLDDIEAAKRLRSSVTWDQPLSPMLYTDFGVATDHHYLAIRQSDATHYELDRALGDGQAITQLVRETTDERFQDIEFETPYDMFYDLSEMQRGQPQTERPRQGVDNPLSNEQEAQARPESVVETNQEKDRGRDR